MRAPLKDQSDYAELIAYAETTREPLKWKAMLVMSFELGLRPIEIAQLDTNQIRGGELRIRQGHTKGKRGRSLPIRQEAIDALLAYTQGRQGPVFLNAKGEAMDAASVSSAMRRLYREAGQTGSCYSGRRTLLTDLVERDVNILTVQSIAGHSSPVTTLQYVGVTPSMMRKALYGE